MGGKKGVYSLHSIISCAIICKLSDHDGGWTMRVSCDLDFQISIFLKCKGNLLVSKQSTTAEKNPE